jgi:hypothetical protein
MKTIPDPQSLGTFVDPKTRDYIIAVFENFARQTDLRLRAIEARIDKINGPQDKAIAELRADFNDFKDKQPMTKNDLVLRLRKLQDQERFDG